MAYILFYDIIDHNVMLVDWLIDGYTKIVGTTIVPFGTKYHYEPACRVHKLSREYRTHQKYPQIPLIYMESKEHPTTLPNLLKSLV